jgi:hypothetical protein
MMASSFVRVMDENKDGVVTRESSSMLLPGGSRHGGGEGAATEEQLRAGTHRDPAPQGGMMPGPPRF